MKKEHIKFVKKANQWCRTTFVKGEQKQEWSVKKPKPKYGNSS